MKRKQKQLDFDCALYVRLLFWSKVPPLSVQSRPAAKKKVDTGSGDKSADFDVVADFVRDSGSDCNGDGNSDSSHEQKGIYVYVSYMYVIYVYVIYVYVPNLNV